jgi:hypothetical protein
VLPPSTGPRRGPTARHRRTTDRSSATADGPLGIADLRTTTRASELHSGSSSRDAQPSFERSCSTLSARRAGDQSVRGRPLASIVEVGSSG